MSFDGQVTQSWEIVSQFYSDYEGGISPKCELSTSTTTTPYPYYFSFLFLQRNPKTVEQLSYDKWSETEGVNGYIERHPAGLRHTTNHTCLRIGVSPFFES